MSMYLLNDMLHDLETMRPHRLLDQHFGMGLSPEEILASPSQITPYHHHHGRVAHHHPGRLVPHPGYHRQWALANRDAGSTVHFDKDKFHVNLDVQQFAPHEIVVKVVDNHIVVEGNHDEKQDEHGYIKRHFVRRYHLPKEYNCEDVVSHLSSDGVLSISAPRIDKDKPKERVVPIMHTGPHKAVKDAPKENGDKKEEEAKQ